MPDRLSELLQQRRLIQEHLAWLDREIAAATKPTTSASSVSTASVQQPTAPVAAAPLPTPTASPTATRLETPLPSASPLDPDALLAEYQQDPQNLQVDVKRGCFLYFGIAMGFLFLLVALAYINYLRHHSDTSAPPPTHPAVEKR